MQKGPFFFPSVKPPQNLSLSLADWCNWKWQIKQRLSSADAYSRYIDLTEQEKLAFIESASSFKVQTTPYYASLIQQATSREALKKIMVPSLDELSPAVQEMLDPLGERKHRPVSRVIHRYPDRVLLLATDTCSVYCRYCTRKHFTGKDQAKIRAQELEEAFQYLSQHQEIKEVIFSGGDPLTLSDAAFVSLVQKIREIKHIELIRIGSRMPVVAPMRITEELLAQLKPYGPIYFMHHFNHPEELTKESVEAIEKIVDAGMPSFNQLVLLRGVNNKAKIIEDLSRRLLYLRVKPYYMFQCDPSEGTDYLRTSIEESLQIQEELWGRVSGLAMPRYSIDIPNGGGKTTIAPNHLVKKEKNKITFKGWDGIVADYVSPEYDGTKD